jgi:putative membrane protein
MTWIGTLFSLLSILEAHGKAGKDAQEHFASLEKSSGIALDVGATLTMLFGVLLLVLPEGGTAIMKGAGFFHAKLVLVVLIIVYHVLVRRKIRKFREGDMTPIASWLFPACFLTVLSIIVLIMVRPF